MLTAHAFRHIGLAVPPGWQGAQASLFEDPPAEG
jgi:Holliday junction DNA helicase RuvB